MLQVWHAFTKNMDSNYGENNLKEIYGSKCANLSDTSDIKYNTRLFKIVHK